MRLAGLRRRVLPGTAPRPRSLAFLLRATCALTIGLLACRGDTLTDPAVGASLKPTDPLLTLTGGAGVEIFPTVSPGDPQPVGVAVGLNDAGQVTGSAYRLVSSDDDNKPYRWSVATGAVKLVGCCDTEWGNDINDAGTVVGTAQTDALRGTHAWVATGTTMTTLPILPGGEDELNSGAIAINNSGQIVGVSPVAGGAFATHAVLWSAGGAIQDLGTLGGTNSAAIDINDAGQVIGSSQIAGDAATHFFLWSSAAGMQDLNTIIDPNVTSVVEINASGQIIGTYTASGGAHAFLYTPGSGLRDLGTLGGTTSAPTGLNDKGDVVGRSTLGDGSTHAFLWTATDGMEDVTALTGVPEVRRLNDNLQTLTGTAAPSTTPLVTSRIRPRLVQLQVTQSNTPPQAVFTVQCNGLTCELDATSSLDDKPGLSYAWNLGKLPGGSATGALVTVTYAHASQRTVTLTVTDAQGLTSSTSKTFTVTDYPVAAFTAACTGLTCSFDAAASTNGGSPIEEYLWSFGDGVGAAASNPTSSHTYAQAGTYTVTLEVRDYTNNRRGSVTRQVTVSAPASNTPPVADFTWSCNGTVCTLDASSSTDDKGIVAYDWSLGKAPGGTASGVVVSTDYWHNGPRTVTLTVTDAGGLANSITKTVDVGSSPPPPPPPVDAAPVARFTYSCSGTVCTMDASTSSDDVGITSYDWSLGKAPGGSATGVTVSTDYWHSSTRTVTLTVTDTKGQTNSVTQSVIVP